MLLHSSDPQMAGAVSRAGELSSAGKEVTAGKRPVQVLYHIFREMQSKTDPVQSLGYRPIAESWASQENHQRLVERQNTSCQMEAGGKRVRDTPKSLFSFCTHIAEMMDCKHWQEEGMMHCRGWCTPGTCTMWLVCMQQRGLWWTDQTRWSHSISCP